MVGLDGLEPSTSRLSGVRSNQAELQALIRSFSMSIKERFLNPSKLNSDPEPTRRKWAPLFSFLRKEVIQPLVPQRLPCYDFTLIINHTLGVYPPCGLAQQLLVQSTLMV
jgi:hypothetical protein